MSEHLSEQGVCMYLIGDASTEARRHANECAACQARIAGLVTSLGHFRGAVRNWSDLAGARDRAAELRWTVILAADPLEHLLLPSLEMPWYRSLWGNLRDLLSPDSSPLDVTSKPLLVRDIWGQYRRQKRSWVMSVALQTMAVLLLVTVVSTKIAPQKVVRMIPLLDPNVVPYEPKQLRTADKMPGGGGGGGDHSPLPPSQGRLPKVALKQFTPPSAVPPNSEAKLTIEPSIVAPPDVMLPQVNMAQYGDPLARLGPASNGPGTGGGIGTGVGGGIGPGKVGGFGPGEGGGIGGGVFRTGGVSAPTLLHKVEPEYSEEARKAKYQGVVILYIEVDPSGRAQNVRVLHSLGLGLDEKAIEAVRKWKFRPGYKDGRPVTVAATVEVNFRLL